MKAIDLAQKLYPDTNRNYIINNLCPDELEICDKINCKDINCINCWERDISQVRCDWLIEAKKIENFIK